VNAMTRGRKTVTEWPDHSYNWQRTCSDVQDRNEVILELKLTDRRTSKHAAVRDRSNKKASLLFSYRGSGISSAVS